MKKLQEYKYKNITFLLLSFILIIIITRYQPFIDMLLNLGNLGYMGIFVAGVLFVSTFTVAILLILTEKFSPIEIGIIAGFGAAVGDFAIFRFVKDNLMEEIVPIYNHIGGRRITAMLHKKYLSWTLPVIGAFIIASPFPDELGVSLMGISKIKTYQFLLITFALNAMGIFLFVSAANSLSSIK
jgi:hypothetical protein